MNKILLQGYICVLLCVSTALADDINIPFWWRASPNPTNDPTLTYQGWEFGDDNSSPLPDLVSSFGPGGVNVYGFLPLTAQPANPPYNEWLESYGAESGVWKLSSRLVVPINNDPTPRSEKDIWIQITWLPQTEGAEPAIFAWTTDPSSRISEVTERELDRRTTDTGYIHSTYELSIFPCPDFEVVEISGSIFVSELVIDTRSIPEPATASMLVTAGLAVMFRRRQA